MAKEMLLLLCCEMDCDNPGDCSDVTCDPAAMTENGFRLCLHPGRKPGRCDI